MYGMTYEQFLQNGGLEYFYGIGVYSDEELVKYINDMIKSDLVCISLIQAENLEITDEEYRLLLDELIAETGMTEEKVLEAYGGEENIKNSMLFDEANKLIYKENTLVVKEQ
jgi:FKBP-type peptidyl-prolyl cis-trans isomerase (trigger factor)